MSPERWRQINELFASALNLAAAERGLFLQNACGTDVELRQEVDSLLSAHSEPDNLVDKPIGEIAAELLQQESLIGRAISHYRIESLLGRGGMGEVYLARDMDLGRPVAVKLLPASFVRDPNRLRRFQQEARLASSLNHPNIVTIYELGEADGLRFLVTEYVAGRTLRELLREAPVSLPHAIDIAAQTANALAAAHEAGIVHRDIKPENLMLRNDGYIKVLDFGLAKVADQNQRQDILPSRLQVTTRTGMVMGTASYMSPEQARGLPVDARTDIFSLGVVLYELVTGQPPFKGETPSHIIVAIIENDPPPLADCVPQAAAQLQTIINRALAKKPADRYATSRALLDDLRSIQTDAAQNLQTLSPVGHKITGKVTSWLDTGGYAKTATDPSAAAAHTGAVVNASPTLTPSTLFHRRNFLKLGAGVGLTALGAAAGLRWWGRNPPLNPAQLTMKRLTASGNIGGVVISPDGQYVAYAIRDKDSATLWLKQLANDSARELLPATKNHLYGWWFCPTDNSLYYWIVNDDSAESTGVFRIPLLGGAPRKILGAGNSGGPFSRNGQRFAYISSAAGQTIIRTANADGEDIKDVIAFSGGYKRLWGLAWSPDDAAITYAMRDIKDSAIFFYVAEAPANGGPETILIPPGRQPSLKAPFWQSNTRNLIYLAPDPATKNSQIWRQNVSTGQAQRLTNDLNEYIGISASADGQTVAAIQQEGLSNIWVGLDGGRKFQQITGGRNNFGTPNWTPDGRLVYISNESGAEEIWLMNADGGNRQQLTNGLSGIWSDPIVGLDGHSIVYVSVRSGTRQLWRIDFNGKNMRQLTNAQVSYIFQGQLLSDGQTVIFRAQIPGDFVLLFRQTAGSEPQPLTPPDSFTGDWNITADGKLLACSLRLKGEPGPRLRIISLADNVTQKTFNLEVERLRWTGDNQRLSFRQSASGNFATQALQGGPPQPLFNPSPEPLQGASWSTDGKRVAVVCGRFINDALLFKFAELKALE